MEAVSKKHKGICSLCWQHAELCDSHLIPKWAYRRLQRNVDGRGDPVRIKDGKAILTSTQITQYLLCAECEQRFSSRENSVAQLTEVVDGKIRLFEYVTRLETPHRLLAKLHNEIDVATLVYFAASMIWRSAAMHRSCHLGPYELQFRNYLLDTAPFPASAALTMGILEPSTLTERPYALITEPASMRALQMRVHGFILCGLAFRCVVGKAIQPAMKRSGLADTNPDKYALLLPSDRCGDFLSAFDMLAGAKPRGKLSNNSMIGPGR